MLALPAERLLQQALRRTSLALRHIRHKQEAAAAAGQHKKQAGAGRAALRSEIKRELRRFRTPPALEPAWRAPGHDAGTVYQECAFVFGAEGEREMLCVAVKRTHERKRRGEADA